MNRIAKTALIATTAAAISLGSVTAFAGWNGFGKGCDRGDGPGRAGMMMKKYGKPGRFADRDLNLTADEAKTLVAARLIMRGNDRLKVGEVTEKDDQTYLVEITTVDDSLVRNVEVDKDNGLPRGRPGMKK